MRKPLETLAVFLLHLFCLQHLAGLTEMNLRRIFERKIRSRSSKNTPYLYDPRTFETENKGWSKWFGFPIPCFLHFCLFTCTTWAFPAINKSHCLAACQYRILLWITVSMPEKTAVFTRCPGQSSLRKPVGFVILAGPYGYEFVRIEPDILGWIDGIACKHDTSPWQITCAILS